MQCQPNDIFPNKISQIASVQTNIKLLNFETLRCDFHCNHIPFLVSWQFSTQAIGQNAFTERWARKPSHTVLDQQQLSVQARELHGFQYDYIKPQGGKA